MVIMSASPKAPGQTTVTHKSRTKKRYVRLDEISLIDVLRVAAKPIPNKVDPRAAAVVPDARFVGAFTLPTNNVMELYRRGNGEEVAFVFSSLDVWMTATAEDLAQPGNLI